MRAIPSAAAMAAPANSATSSWKSTGRPCPCGNRGCLEQYASLASALAALSHPIEGTAEEKLAAAFAARDEGLMAWVETAARHLRTAIVSLENIFDPEVVLLGGIIPEPLLDAIYERILPLPRSVTSRESADERRLVKSNFGPAIPAMGAASLALFEATSADLSLLFKKTNGTSNSRGNGTVEAGA